MYGAQVDLRSMCILVKHTIAWAQVVQNDGSILRESCMYVNTDCDA